METNQTSLDRSRFNSQGIHRAGQKQAETETAKTRHRPRGLAWRCAIDTTRCQAARDRNFRHKASTNTYALYLQEIKQKEPPEAPDAFCAFSARVRRLEIGASSIKHARQRTKFGNEVIPRLLTNPCIHFANFLSRSKADVAVMITDRSRNFAENAAKNQSFKCNANAFSYCCTFVRCMCFDASNTA